MSPAATRRYIVRFTDWTLYETVVPASSKREALAKAIALYNATGVPDLPRVLRSWMAGMPNVLARSFGGGGSGAGASAPPLQESTGKARNGANVVPT